jgi:hypothetical protein
MAAAGGHGQKAGHFIWVRRSKLAFAMVLRIQSRVEQLRNLVQGRSPDGRVFLGCGVVMASSESWSKKTKHQKKQAVARVIGGFSPF